MYGDDVFIAFANKKTALAVAKIVIANGFNAAAAVLNAGDLLGKIGYYDGGIIICGCRFGDGSINTLIDEIPQGFRVIAIGSPEDLQYCDERRMLTLSVPLNSADLLAYLDMLRSGAKLSNRTPEEDALINRAKRMLIAKKGVTEAKAHRFLEKKSMDLNRTMAETAEAVLRSLENGSK